MSRDPERSPLEGPCLFARAAVARIRGTWVELARLVDIQSAANVGIPETANDCKTLSERRTTGDVRWSFCEAERRRGVQENQLTFPSFHVAPTVSCNRDI